MINALLGTIGALAIFFAIMYTIAFIGSFINKDKE